MIRSSASQSLLRYLQIIVFLSLILYFGRGLLIPVLYGMFIAIVLFPFCKKLEELNWPKSLAIAAGMSIVVAFFLLICSLFVYQLNFLMKDLPSLAQKINPALLQLNHWLTSTFGISGSMQIKWWAEIQNLLKNNIGHMAQLTISAATNAVILIFLSPVFSVLFLYERKTFIRFLVKITGNEFRGKLYIILHEIVTTYSRFITGMALVYLIVGCLNTLGLLVLGIPHALLFGINAK